MQALRNAAIWVFGLTVCGSRSPQPHEGRIEQTCAPVRTKHRYTLGQIVQRLALHTYRGVVAAFEIDLFGQVLEDPGDAAVWMRVGDDADGAAVRQVPGVLLRLDSAVGGQDPLFPFAPFRLFGNLAVAAQPIKKQRIVGRAFEKLGVELPKLLERLVEEAQLFVSIENRNRRGQTVERIGMAACHARGLLFACLDQLISAAMPTEPPSPAKSVTWKI